MLCNICEKPTLQCPNCGFVQTKQPYWLHDAYSSAISDIDIGVVNRSVTFSRLTRNLILSCFDSNAAFLDLGGGPGVFVRMMRDQGFNFYIYDKYCENMFARGFEADMSGASRYELITAFEVFEHFVSPLDDIQQMLRCSRNVLFSTLLLPAHNPSPGEWWYYALEHGQHVSIYTYKSLAIIAQRLGLYLHSNGTSLHLLTEKQISPRRFQFIFRKKISALLNLFYVRRQRKHSLLEDDFAQGSGLSLR
jgi:Methyltransferase domain